MDDDARPHRPIVTVHVHRLRALDDLHVAQAADLLRELVAAGAALGWVDPPPTGEVQALLAQIQADAAGGDASLAVALEPRERSAGGDRLVGLGYWRRYARPTHRVHADIEKVAVDPRFQRGGVGRAIMTELVAAAREAGIEVLTLDLRGDNAAAERLYTSLGFRRFGLLEHFVAVGSVRYDKLFYALDLRERG